MPYQFDEHDLTSDVKFDIARGHFKNAKAVNLFGFNETIGITYETIAKDGGGIMGVLVQGLDAAYNQISETVTLTGTTPVTTTQSFLRINAAQIVTGSNVGNITISNGGTTYSYIAAGFGSAQAVIYTVPANSKLYINAVSFASGTVNPNKYLTGRAYLKTADGAIINFWRSTWAVGFLQFNVPVPFTVPEKCDFSIEAKSSSGENEISCYINAHLVIDE